MIIQLDCVVFIGVVGDFGCGKFIFLCCLMDLFGEEFMMVICLDDYYSLDCQGRKVVGVIVLDFRVNNFDFMYEQIKMFKSG